MLVQPTAAVRGSAFQVYFVRVAARRWRVLGLGLRTQGVGDKVTR
jgi:hypothetical protein